MEGADTTEAVPTSAGCPRPMRPPARHDVGRAVVSAGAGAPVLVDVLDAYAGALLGAAFGDALGAPHETTRDAFGIVGSDRCRGGGPGTASADRVQLGPDQAFSRARPAA